MHRGYIRQWRKEIESDIWDMPPLYYKVWRYILMAADHKTHELQTTCNIVADKISWHENRALRVPNRKTVRKILLWLHERNQGVYSIIGTGKHKMVKLTIINYHTYNPLGPNRETKNGQVVKEHSSKSSTRTVPSQESFPDWVSAILDNWEDIAGLPRSANRHKCKKAIYDLWRIDKHDPELIAEVVEYIAKEKAPKFIASPMKLRSKTKAGDQQTFEMYAREHQPQVKVETAPWRTT